MDERELRWFGVWGREGYSVNSLVAVHCPVGLCSAALKGPRDSGHVCSLSLLLRVCSHETRRGGNIALRVLHGNAIKVHGIRLFCGLPMAMPHF